MYRIVQENIVVPKTFSQETVWLMARDIGELQHGKGTKYDLKMDVEPDGEISPDSRQHLMIFYVEE